jgi:hypothetical protein
LRASGSHGRSRCEASRGASVEARATDAPTAASAKVCRATATEMPTAATVPTGLCQRWRCHKRGCERANNGDSGFTGLHFFYSTIDAWWATALPRRRSGMVIFPRLNFSRGLLREVAWQPA